MISSGNRGQALIEFTLTLPVCLALGALLLATLEINLSRQMVNYHLDKGLLCLGSTETDSKCCQKLKEKLNLIPHQHMSLLVCQRQTEVAQVHLKRQDVWGFTREVGRSLALPLRSHDL